MQYNWKHLYQHNSRCTSEWINAGSPKVHNQQNLTTERVE